MRTVSVKAHTRRIADKPADPLQELIDARRAVRSTKRQEISETEQREQLSMIGKLMRRLGWRG